MVELSVTMVILVIAMGLAATLILSSGGFLTKDSEMNAAKYIGDGVYSWVENRVRYAGSMTLCEAESPLAQTNKSIYIGGDGDMSGHLVYADFGSSPADVFGSQFYLGNTVKLYASANSEGVDLLNLRVDVLNSDNNVVYTTGSTIKLVNISLKPNNRIESESSAGETPLICFSYAGGEASGYSDPDISSLASICEPLSQAINRLQTENRNEQITALLGGQSPSDSALRSAALKDLGGSWPNIKDKKIGNQGNAQKAEAHFMVKDGYIVGVVYYAPNGQGNEDKTQFIYNTRADCWYTKKGNFTLSSADNYGSYDLFLDYIETDWMPVTQ